MYVKLTIMFNGENQPEQLEEVMETAPKDWFQKVEITDWNASSVVPFLIKQRETFRRTASEDTRYHLVAIGPNHQEDSLEDVLATLQENRFYDEVTVIPSHKEQSLLELPSKQELRNANPHYDHNCRMMEKFYEFAPKHGELFYLAFDGQTFVGRWDEIEQMWYTATENNPDSCEASIDLDDILGRVPTWEQWSQHQPLQKEQE